MKHTDPIHDALELKGLDQERWCIYIDIEGFGALFGQEHRVLRSLGVLSEGILRIGQKCFPDTPDRLFAHQTGDGFAIVSEFGAEVLERPLAIAVALMRHVASSGRFAKAALSQGDFADFRGCYPDSIRKAEIINGHLALGHGVMTLFPVMGTALIRAVKLTESSPSGPLLIVASADQHRIPGDIGVREITESSTLSIDWIHFAFPSADSVSRIAGLNSPTADSLDRSLASYCHSQELKQEWVTNVRDLLGVPL
jgi:hypothetical protein